jgi:hypothetical protein
MKQSKLFAGLLSALVLLSVAGNAMAMNQWQRKDEHRIRQGVHNGTINPHEARQLRRREAHINRYAEQAHRSGGHIGLGERMKIQQMKANERVAIFKDKHDRH